MPAPVPVSVRKLILKKYADGQSYSEIGRELCMARQTVWRIVKHFDSVGSVVPKKRVGRPPKVSSRSVRHLVRMCRICPHMSSEELKSGWESGHTMSARNIRLILAKHGLRSRIAAKKLKLSYRHRRTRVNWCKIVLQNTQEQWNCVLFSDEASFQLEWSRKEYVKRPTGSQHRYHPRFLAKFSTRKSKSLMVFAFISASGLRTIARFPTKCDSDAYTTILQNHLLPNLDESCIFQQDNAPIHTSRHTLSFLEENSVMLLPDWPPYSPDLNIIEHLWKKLKNEVYRNRSYQNIDDLWAAIQREFYKIPDIFFSNLYSSIKRRLQCVIQSRGYPTKY
jgi:transposase